MNTASPLRYPGGKARLANMLRVIGRLNGLGNRWVAEPFAGGAGASLTLLYHEATPGIFINDADPAINNFWWAITRRTDAFIDKLLRTPISLPQWRKQREIYRRKNRVSKFERGFATFYLNRCNRSGIVMNGGPIGGFGQTGDWGLAARFSKPSLVERIRRVAEYRDRINVVGDDGLAFIKQVPQAETFLFIDPPYCEKGQTLYLNALDEEYHCALASQLKSMDEAAWVLTYDDCARIRDLYSPWAVIRPFSLQYTAGKRKRGKEILISPRWMQTPPIVC